MYKKILLINPFGIGDVLFTTPVIHTLKDVFSGVKIGYLCNSRTAPLLKNNPYIDSVFIYDRDEFEATRKESFLKWLKKNFNFIRQLKKERFDLAIDFSMNTQYGYFCWLAGIKERVGYDYKKRGILLTKKIALTGYSLKHVVEYYMDLLKFLGIEPKYKKLELYLNPQDLRRSEELLRSNGISPQDSLVTIIPGGGRSWGKDAHLKHWPVEKFAQLADKIIANYPVKLILMGDFFEKEISEELLRRLNQKAVDLCGKTSLGEFAAILSRAKLAIANDGGPLHMGVASRIKTVSIFGPVDEKVYGPYPMEENHIVMKKDLACRPCYQNFKMRLCEDNKKCINDISVDDVFLAVRRLL